MIKKSVFEDELIAVMQIKLAGIDTSNSLSKAVDYINSAIDIFEDAGMTSKASALLNILAHLAQKNTDQYTNNLTPERMVENYKKHGIPFNMSDDGSTDKNSAEDLLDLEVGDDIEVRDGEPGTETFEDER
jgi:hypothetical protein